mmetsp:Transcript_2449/g.6536  ORF Transcript_2449/g.6536 Transcript_2449/m.6536 type:complete len:220 (-) Transcript_2449:1014-1673(-)
MRLKVSSSTTTESENSAPPWTTRCPTATTSRRRPLLSRYRRMCDRAPSCESPASSTTSSLSCSLSCSPPPGLRTRTTDCGLASRSPRKLTRLCSPRSRDALTDDDPAFSASTSGRLLLLVVVVELIGHLRSGLLGCGLSVMKANLRGDGSDVRIAMPLLVCWEKRIQFNPNRCSPLEIGRWMQQNCSQQASDRCFDDDDDVVLFFLCCCFVRLCRPADA